LSNARLPGWKRVEGYGETASENSIDRTVRLWNPATGQLGRVDVWEGPHSGLYNNQTFSGKSAERTVWVVAI